MRKDGRKMTQLSKREAGLSIRFPCCTGRYAAMRAEVLGVVVVEGV